MEPPLSDSDQLLLSELRLSGDSRIAPALMAYQIDNDVEDFVDTLHRIAVLPRASYKPDWMALPGELWIAFMEFLDAPALLTCARVCKQFFTWARRDAHWRRLCADIQHDRVWTRNVEKRPDHSYMSYYRRLLVEPLPWGLDAIPILAKVLQNKSLPTDKILAAMLSVRKMLSVNDPPISKIIESGMVPRMIELLEHEHAELRFETLWSITNLAAGDNAQAQALILAGILPALKDILHTTKLECELEQACWCVGNIAGTSHAIRDLVIEAGCLAGMIQALQAHMSKGFEPISLYRNAFWAVSNCMRGNPPPDRAQCTQALPLLGHVIGECRDEDVLQDAAWSLVYLAQGDNKCLHEVRCVADLNLVHLLSHPAMAVAIPALRAVGNILSGGDGDTTILVRLGVVAQLESVLSRAAKVGMRKEVCWALSNIAATAGHSSALRQGQIPQRMVHILRSEADIGVIKEAVWVCHNMSDTGDSLIHSLLLENDLLTHITPLLDRLDKSCVVQMVINFVNGPQREQAIRAIKGTALEAWLAEAVEQGFADWRASV